ncbi:ubiquitin carboxyl-terminal hydrolase 8 [Pectinophora gossypiella]|uniref:ubiquitin carboxyl-terminal hydrolase 8 n=1 Tax=Pectinophora gossypiella TaxID=13191 RepID=UPI00214E140E|nr:ubiquitin carboxyl-terminal hydrolase 8 [Pectinophora gossypiella]
MAIIRDPINYDNTANYIASLAFICSISCTILMLKFRGFKASLNFASGKKLNSEFSEDVSPVSVTGAYRLSRNEFFESGSLREPHKTISPSMVKLPPVFQPDPTDPDVIKSKSTSNLAQPANVPTHLSKSTPNISTDPKGGKNNDRNSTDIRKPNTKEAKNQEKQQKKLEKQRLVEQKKQEKIEAQERAKQEKLQKERAKVEAQERAKQEKLVKEREKAEAQRRAKEAKGQKQKNKTKPVTKTKANNPLARGPDAASGTSPYTTNTLDSSISKTSGPPPYSDDQPPIQASNPSMVQNANDDTGNTSFGKPIETDNTWDMIAQHRQQINRVPVSGGVKQAIDAKQTGQRFYLTDNNAVTGRKSLYV